MFQPPEDSWRTDDRNIRFTDLQQIRQSTFLKATFANFDAYLSCFTYWCWVHTTELSPHLLICTEHVNQESKVYSWHLAANQCPQSTYAAWEPVLVNKPYVSNEHSRGATRMVWITNPNLVKQKKDLREFVWVNALMGIPWSAVRAEPHWEGTHISSSFIHSANRWSLGP